MITEKIMYLRAQELNISVSDASWRIKLKKLKKIMEKILPACLLKEV